MKGEGGGWMGEDKVESGGVRFEWRAEEEREG